MNIDEEAAKVVGELRSEIDQAMANRDEQERLKEKAEAELARKGELADHLEGGMASITDFLNTELRENYGGQFQVDQYTDPQAIKAGIRHLVDCIKTHHEQRLARVKAENEQLHEELRSIL